MTKRAITALLLLLSCVPTYMAAQAPRENSAAEATVRALDDQERLAALNHDYAALEHLWSEHFIVNAPTNQILPNRSAVLDHFRRGMTTRSSFERSVEQVRVDGDIAIVMGLETLTPTGSAPLAGQTVRRRFTNIWKKEGDTWRLWARHANVIPATTSEEQLVRSLDDQERRAALARDVAALERLWSPDLTVNAPNSQLLVGRDSTMKLVQQGVINFLSFERDVEFIRILDDIAIVMGSEAVPAHSERPNKRAARRAALRFAGWSDSAPAFYEHLAERSRHLAPLRETRKCHPFALNSEARAN